MREKNEKLLKRNKLNLNYRKIVWFLMLEKLSDCVFLIEFGTMFVEIHSSRQSAFAFDFSRIENENSQSCYEPCKMECMFLK